MLGYPVERRPDVVWEEQTDQLSSELETTTQDLVLSPPRHSQILLPILYSSTGHENGRHEPPGCFASLAVFSLRRIGLTRTRALLLLVRPALTINGQDATTDTTASDLTRFCLSQLGARSRIADARRVSQPCRLSTTLTTYSLPFLRPLQHPISSPTQPLSPSTPSPTCSGQAHQKAPSRPSQVRGRLRAMSPSPLMAGRWGLEGSKGSRACSLANGRW